MKRFKDTSVDYYSIKKIVLDYYFQIGRLKAYHFMSHKFKEESEKIVDEIKLKIKQVRDSMENVDLKLVKSF